MTRICHKTVLGIALVGLLGCGTQSPEGYVQSAKALLAKQDPNGAIIQLKNALQASPTFAEARFLLGKTLAETGDLPAAEKELRKALELHVSADLALPVLASTELRLGNFQSVVDEFGNVSLTSPGAKADVAVSVGEAQIALHHLDAAERAFASSLEIQRAYPPALVGKARVAAIKSQYSVALSLVDQALESGDLPEAWQLKGDLLRVQGNGEAAVEMYRKVVNAQPSNMLARTALISSLAQQGKLDEADLQLKELVAIAPNSPQTQYLQALVAYVHHNYPVAREHVEKQIAAAPEYLPGLLLASSIYYQSGSYAEAEATLGKILERDPDQQLARRLLVSTYMRTGQLRSAFEAIKPVLDKIGNNSDMLALAGEVTLKNGDAQSALRYFEKAAALDPHNGAKRTAVAVTQLSMGDSDLGIRQLEDTAATDSGTSADIALISAMMQRGDYGKALDAITRLEKKEPKSPAPHYLRGVATLAEHDAANARRSFEKAISLDPAYLPAASSLARLDLADHAPDMAKERFERVLAKAPQNSDAMLALADLALQTGRSSEEARKQIDAAIAAKPTDSVPRIALTLLYLRTKEPKKALAAAQEAIAALPGRPEILDILGQAQTAAGQSNQAVVTYKQLAEMRPGTPLSYLRLADSQFAVNDDEAATTSLRKALAIKPDLLAAQRALIRLDVKSGRFSDAIAVARNIQKQHPKDPIGYRVEGDIHALNQDWNGAILAYRTGLRQVESTDLAIPLHATLLRIGHKVDAETLAATWMQDHPRDFAFGFYLAGVARVTKEYAKAVQLYRALLPIQPDHPALLNNLAVAAAEVNDPKALDYAEKAYRLAPAQPEIMDTLGDLLARNGQVDRGLALLRKASAAAPQSASIRLHLARALLKSGQEAAAKEELEQLSKLGKSFSGEAEVGELLKGL